MKIHWDIDNKFNDKNDIKTNIYPSDVEPYIVINNFTETDVETFKKHFTKLDTLPGVSIIPICINSYGGNVHSLLSIIDMIGSTSKPVATICTGKAMSCGAVLLSCGTKGHRYIGENATVMIHEVSNHSWGKINDIKVTTEHTEELNKVLFALLNKNAGHEPGFFEKLVHSNNHADLYLSAEKAKSYGIVDEVRIPSLFTTVTLTQVLV